MTEIHYTIKDNCHTLTLNGHAGYNPGNDIVCASCSTLFYTLVNALLSQSHGRVQYTAEAGHGEVTCEAANDTEKAYFNMAVIGYKALQQEYPGNVKLWENK